MSRASEILSKIKEQPIKTEENIDTPPKKPVIFENKEEFEKAVAAILATVEFARENNMDQAAEKMQQAYDMAMEAAEEIDTQMNGGDDEEPEAEPEEEPAPADGGEEEEM